MIKKRIVWSFVLSFVLIIGLVGPLTAAEKIQIPWMGHFWQAPGYGEWQQAIKDAFEAKYPNVEIVEVSLPWTALTDQEFISLVSPNPPGLLYNWIGNLGQFAATDLLEPLDDYIAKTDIRKRLIPSSLEYAKDKEGRIIAMPNQFTSAVYYYRKDLLDEAGLQVPTTLEESYKVAKKLTSPEKGMFGFAARIHSHGTQLYQQIWSWARAFGGNLADDGVPTLDSPEVIAALLYSKRFFREELAPIAETEPILRGLFISGKIALARGAPHYKVIIREKNPEIYDKVALALVPTPYHRGANLILCFYSIPKNFKHKEWAFKLLEFMSQDEWGDMFTELTKQLYATGRIPESVVKEEPWMLVVAEQAKLAEPSTPPGLEEYVVEYQNAVTPYLVEAVSGSRTVEEVMGEAQRVLEKWAEEKK